MATFQDASIGMVAEATYNTPLTVTRWYEYTSETFDWKKNIKQGKGLRVGSRVARSNRRVVPSADGQGDMVVEAVSKGLGLLLEAAVGQGTSTLVSTGLYQQVFTLADTPKSYTVQKALVEVGGSVDTYTYGGCMVDQVEFDLPNSDIASVKTTWDMANLVTNTAYATPSYSSAPDLFHFADLAVAGGTLTAPTSTALAAGTTTLTDIRSATISVKHNLKVDRFNAGGAGRKVKPTVGLRDISIKLDVEYDSTTWRDLVMNDSPQCLIFTITGTTAVGAGFGTLQIVLPEVKFDNPLAQTNGTDLITTSLTGQVLDNLTAAQPIWVVYRTSDTAL